MSDLREARATWLCVADYRHYNSVFRYLEAEALTPYLYATHYTLAALPLEIR